MSDARSLLRMPARAFAARIAFWYAAIGVLWLLCSGWLLHHLIRDNTLELKLEFVSICAFIILTALLLGLALSHYFRGSEARYQALFDQAVDGIVLMAMDGSELKVNRAFARMHGYDAPEEMGSLPMADLVTPEAVRQDPALARSLLAGEALFLEMEHNRKDGTPVQIDSTICRVDLARKPYLLSFHRDISEQKRNERLRALPGEVLRILTDGQVLSDATQRILDAIKKHTGIEALGIRLRQGNDFPYSVADGYSADFLRSENSITARRSDEDSYLDRHGRVRLECTCGLVISGQTDPSNASFTTGGSAWTNDARQLLQIPADQDPRLHPRNRCVHEGFQSLAFIPIRVRDEIIGLLQMSDRRRDCFTLEMIGYLEGLASSFGVALQRLKEEQALRESERRLATLMATLPGMAYRCENLPDWPMSFVSEGCFPLTGYSTSALMSDQPAYGDVIIEADREYVWNSVQQGLQMHQPFELTYRIRSADDRLKWVWERGRGIFGDEDKLLFIEGFISDITERKQAETEIQDSRSFLNSIIEQTPVPMWISDDRGTLIRLNKACCQTLHITPGEVVGKYNIFLDNIVSEQGKMPLIRSVFEEGKTVNFDLDYDSSRITDITLKQTVSLILNITVFPIRDNAGKIANAVIQYIDITEHKRADELLHESLLFRREAEKIGQIGAWKVSPDTDYLYWTEGVYEILKAPLDYKPGLQEGLKLYDLESIPVLQSALLTCLKYGTPFRVEAGVTTMTGQHIWAEVHGLRRLEEGEQAYVMGTFQDITERRRLEEQYRQSQKLEAIGQLAGGVAHDFNNILAALMMQLDLLQMHTELDAETQQALQDMDVEAHRAASLTRQLLMFSRRSVLSVRPLDLNELIANLLRMLGRLIGEQIDMRFNSKAGLPFVEADAGMLEQVLVNLVVNARDAMPRGGNITLSTALAIMSEQEVVANPNRRRGRFICLAVSDTGIGMDTDTVKRVFEPFFTTKEAGKGTGLGLATVHGIVAQHRGWMEVESQLGLGTTFRVFLPAAADVVVPQDEPSGPSSPMPCGHETILVVEDEDPVRRTIVKALQALGYQIHQAANGQEAMRLWQLHGSDVDLLLTDMVLPEGMNGLELTEQLQSLKPELKVIISSGYSAEIVQAGLPHRDGVVYLPKPYATHTLAEAVRKCLDL